MDSHKSHILFCFIGLDDECAYVFLFHGDGRFMEIYKIKDNILNGFSSASNHFVF